MNGDRRSYPVLPESDLPERYAIEFRPERNVEICQQYGLRFPA